MVVNGNGSLDLAGLTYVEAGTVAKYISPRQGYLAIGPTTADTLDIYKGYTGPSDFGSSIVALESTGSGASVGIMTRGRLIEVPVGYILGTLLTNTGNFNNATFATLGFTPGTYTHTFGSGAHAASIVITSATSVPESTTIALFGLGLLGFSASRRKSAK